jgi:iron-sulfur cluster assembly accessory protein
MTEPSTQEATVRITRNMTIEEILSGFPHKSQRLAQEITNAGLHCVGCGAATWETLEAGMLGHGFTECAIEDLLDKLNAILEETSDTTTITMTKRAADKYREILAEDGKEGWHLRLADRAAGCNGFEYLLDYSEKAKPTDRVFLSHGIEIHVDEITLERFLGIVIDYVTGLNGSGFKISNPNAKSSCACGKSQSY